MGNDAPVEIQHLSRFNLRSRATLHLKVKNDKQKRDEWGCLQNTVMEKCFYDYTKLQQRRAELNTEGNKKGKPGILPAGAVRKQACKVYSDFYCTKITHKTVLRSPAKFPWILRHNTLTRFSALVSWSWGIRVGQLEKRRILHSRSSKLAEQRQL